VAKIFFAPPSCMVTMSVAYDSIFYRFPWIYIKIALWAEESFVGEFN